MALLRRAAENGRIRSRKDPILVETSVLTSTEYQENQFDRQTDVGINLAGGSGETMAAPQTATMPLSAIDEYDIRAAFESLNSGQDISIDDFQTLYLGLGFQPTRMPVEWLRTKVIQYGGDGETVTVEQALKVLSLHSRESRSQQLQESFQLIDQGGKGYVTTEDVQRLVEEVGEPVSEKQAKRMLAFFTSDGRADADDFRRLLSPPEP